MAGVCELNLYIKRTMKMTLGQDAKENQNKASGRLVRVASKKDLNV